jgi:osmotically-inducible protein OsmY
MKTVKKTGVDTSKALKAFKLILTLSSLPLLLGISGCASGSRYEQSTGERIDDHGTSARIKAKLAEDPQHKFEDVNVVTFKGVTQLSGFVNTRDQKTRAGTLAKNVEGVHDVENNITIKD